MVKLKWPCSGGCGTVLEEGEDNYVVIVIDSSGPEEGQTERLCVACAEYQLKSRETGEKYRFPMVRS